MLVAPNVFAGAYVSANVDDFVPKNEISDVKKSKKINSIQKFILKRSLKKLQKQALNPQKSKSKKDYMVMLRIMGPLLIIGLILVLITNGIQFIIAGNVLTGIILTMLGLVGAGLFVLYVIRHSKSTY